MAIKDDGRGFTPTTVQLAGHHGLANMRARAEGLGGTFTIGGDQPGGTRIIVMIPLTRRPTGHRA
jgi:signal transduction histidine kinase